MAEPQFTASEIERMRTIITQHDSLAARENNSFDLNNPPRKHYVHQEFPRLVYNHDTRKYKAVANSEEFDEMLESGWSSKPFVSDPDAPVLSAQDAAEAAQFDEKIAEAKRKRKAS